MPVLVLLLVAGVVEISVLVLVGQALGVLPTIGLLLAAGAAGAWLLRREGRRAVREFGDAARLRRPPAREISDGVIIAAGGVLILVPGLVSDVVGLLCLLPPTRAVLRGRLERAAERRSQALQEQMRAQAGSAGAASTRTRRSADDDVIDGEVVSVTEDDDDTSTGRDTPSQPLPPPGRDPRSGPRDETGGA